MNKKSKHFSFHQRRRIKQKKLFEKEEPMSIEEYNQQIKEAEEEFERGDYITNKEMKKQVKEW